MFVGGKSYLRYDIKCNQLKFHYQVNFFQNNIIPGICCKKGKMKKKKTNKQQNLYGTETEINQYVNIKVILPSAQFRLSSSISFIGI